MLAVLLIVCVVLVLVLGISLIGAGPARVRRRVVHRPARRRRTVIEDVIEPGRPRTSRRVVEYD